MRIKSSARVAWRRPRPYLKRTQFNCAEVRQVELSSLDDAGSTRAAASTTESHNQQLQQKYDTMIYHVSPTGSAGAAGTQTDPFATIQEAVLAARATEGPPSQRIVVQGGSYFDVCVCLGPADAGLRIEAADGDAPILYGGHRIVEWEKDGDEFISAHLDGVEDGRWDFRSLLVNGRLAPRARLPECGTFQHESVFDVRWMSTTAGGWERKPTEEELTTMRYKTGDLGNWMDTRNAEVTVFHQWDDSLVGVASLDPATRTLRFATPCGHPPGAFIDHNEKARNYIVWNIREGMTRPGQWYLDRTRGRLVYWPRHGEKIEDLEIIAPTRQSIVSIRGADKVPVRDIRIAGLTLSCTTTALKAAGFGAFALDGAVSIEGPADGLHLDNLTITGIGGQAIRAGHVTNSRMTSCHITDCGGPGIMVRGTNNHVENCTLCKIGQIYPAAIALSVGGKASTISHNHINGCPYTAIQSSGEKNRIEANRIENYMEQLDDGAAIYITFCQDMVIRRNLTIGSSGRQAHAYYMDEQAERCMVEDCVALNTTWPSHNHMASNCALRNNIFVDNGPMKLTFMKCRDFAFEQNILCAEGDVIFVMRRDGLETFCNNIVFSRHGGQTVNWTDDGYGTTETTDLTLRDGSVSEDPKLIRRSDEVWSFAEDSAAAPLEIHALDLTNVGPTS